MILATAVVLWAGLAGGCNRPGAGAEPVAPAAAAEPPAVEVVHPVRQDVRRRIERPGYDIEAYERTALYAKLPGYVHKWNVDMGDPVRKGDVLAELSITEMDVELRQKEAGVRQAASEVAQANAAVLRARAELRRTEAQSERLARVGRSGVLDKEQVDEARFGYESAQAAVAKAEADVDVAKARLEVARADRDHVQTLLQYTKIRAPFDGVVTGRRTVNTGDFVQPAGVGKGESLFVVERIKPARVFVNLPELDAAWVRDGDVALIRVQSLRGEGFKGTVTRLSRSLNPQTRTLRTEVDLPNEDGRLLPGMFVNATIIAARKQVWALPAAAVVTQGEQSFCYRIEDGKAVRTPLQIGLRGDDLVEVVQKQVPAATAGTALHWEEFTGREVVVAKDTGTLNDGQAVTVGRQP